MENPKSQISNFELIANQGVPLRPLPHLVRQVWIQAVRRNEIYVIAILLGLYAVGALVMRLIGIGSAQSARFITDLGLQLGSMLSSLLVILMGARQLAMELELRTIHPVLAKPVTRTQVLLGKSLPTWLTGVAAMTLFAVATLAVTPRLPYQRAGVMAQVFLLKSGSLAMLTALVFWLSLRLPLAVAALVAGLLYFLGAPFANMAAHAAGAWAAPLAGCVPDFALLHQFNRYVDGGAPLSLSALAGYFAYAALWTAIFTALAVRRFARMRL